jgi:hypothetical protein
MKDANDPGTRDLVDEAPYLVISNTKKGFREFKKRYSWQREYLGEYNWTWGKFKDAERFEVGRLPELLKAIEKRRAVTVAIVMQGELHVLGITKYPV